MKNILPLYIVILLATLASCKEQTQKAQSKNEGQSLTYQVSSIALSGEKVDTIFAANAPSRITRKIRRYKKGNLLFAAFKDVLLYDGNTFSKIPKADGFESFDAFDALEDSKGNIWIASTHFGVFCYDGENFIHFTTDNGLAHNRTMAIYEDKHSNIWIATAGGVSCYDGKSFRNYTTKEGLTHNDINTILEDKTGKIWFGTRGTTCVYDPSTAEFTEVFRKDGMPFTNVWTLLEDKRGTIWIGGKDGLWQYKNGLFTNFTTEFINCVYEDKQGNIWTASSQGVLNRYNKQSLLSGKAMPVEIFQNDTMFFSVTEDEKGTIWVGSLRGVFKYDGKSVSYLKANS